MAQRREGATSISNPLKLTQAYAARFTALGGITLAGDARTLTRNGGRWRIDTEEGGVDAPDAVIALGPWSPDVLAPLGIELPMAVKRGYHRHFRAHGNAGLSRPVLDAVSALVNLGYGQPQAAAAIAAASRSAGEKAETAQLIRLGLKELSK